ncbi:MAG: hypothetical protein R3268_12410 [Acidiferrobacterales bacterium]|nr:hypothetical protein [Acidiferrobacterales bacterium]
MERVTAYISAHFVKFGVIAYFLGHLPLTYQREYWGYFASILWKLTSFHVNYVDFGFVKRGVVGTAVKPIFDALDDGGFGELAFLFAFDIACVAIFFYLFSKVCDNLLKDSKDLKNYIKSVAAISPVGLAQFAYDVGRLDHLNYILLVVCIVAIAQGKFILSGFLGAVAILIHEAFFLYGAPVLIAFAISRKTDLRRFYAFVFTMLYAAGLVFSFGNSTVPLDQILSEEASIGSEVWDRGIFLSNLPLSVYEYFSVVPYLIAAYLLLYRVYSANDMKVDLIFLSTFAPLVLFALGIDFFRWTHIVVVVVVAAIFVKSTERTLSFSTPGWRLRDAPLLLLLLPLGPIGIDIGFPVVLKVIDFVSGTPW